MTKSTSDRELQEWFATQEDGAELAIVAERISRFGGDAPAAVLGKPTVSLAARRSSLRRRFSRAAAAAILLLAGTGVGFYLNQAPSRSQVAWGDVVLAMQKVEHFHITAFRELPGEPLSRMDWYYQRPDLWRVHGLNAIQFGVGEKARMYSVNDGKFVAPFPDVPLRSSVPRFIPADFPEAIKQKGLLDAVVGTIFGTAPPLPKMVADPELQAAGIQIFDYEDKATGLSARIWVLERSRLPIRLHIGASDQNSSTWVDVDYSEVVPADFFDATLFEQKIQAGGPPTTREAYGNHFVVDEVAAWYRAACQWHEDPTTVKYSENPADLPALGDERRYQDGPRTVRGVSFNVAPVDKYLAYHANGEKVLESERGVLFVHERTSTTGVRRLVELTNPTFEGPYLRFTFMQVGRSGATYAWLHGTSDGVDMTGICGSGEIRLFAGQPDLKDASRFSIPFETPRLKGWIDGVFMDSGVKLSVRKGPN